MTCSKTAIPNNRMGMVYLVGAGPGDPGLITVKGVASLQKADVVVYDYLANPAFLEHAPEGAEQIYVGKQGGAHTLGQAQINQLIVEQACQGKTVVRLKGGDPFLFGRGGEEAEELSRAGVPFEVVPGVTSAISVPAYAGIPLTHRDHTATVAFVTGHEDPLKEKSNILWDKLSTGAGTLVFLMGVGNLPHIVARLMENGRSPDTPVAVIEQGTLSSQRTIVGHLHDIDALSRERGLKPPAIIVVGEVVALRDHLNWFESRPLFGKRILVTRAREQASTFLEQLEILGAQCIQFPTIQVVPPETWAPLDKAIEELETFDWVIFTSANGVKFFLERLAFLEKDVRLLKGIRIGAIGPKTARAWQDLGIRVDLIPDEYRAEAVVEAMKRAGAARARVLIPRAAEAREVLPEELLRMGADVCVAPAYRTIRPYHDTEHVRRLLKEGMVDMVTFTSSSTVTNFVGMFEGDVPALQEWMAKTTVACIGPVTADTARSMGFAVQVLAEEYTIESLTRSILAWFSQEPKGP